MQEHQREQCEELACVGHVADGVIGGDLLEEVAASRRSGRRVSWARTAAIQRGRRQRNSGQTRTRLSPTHEAHPAVRKDLTIIGVRVT